jgi:hypothetical protein
MDRSAWALSLIAAMASWYLPAPCAAQSPPARGAKVTPPPELLPPLEPLKDPLEKRERSGPSVPAAVVRQQKPATSETEDPAPQIPTTAAVASELQTEGWQLLKESLSPVPSWIVPIESWAKPSARPWPLTWLGAGSDQALVCRRLDVSAQGSRGATERPGPAGNACPSTNTRCLGRQVEESTARVNRCRVADQPRDGTPA